MTDFLACLSYVPHIEAMLLCAFALGASIGGIATAIALAVRR